VLKFPSSMLILSTELVLRPNQNTNIDSETVNKRPITNTMLNSLKIVFANFILPVNNIRREM
jgi:hypothetical protein